MIESQKSLRSLSLDIRFQAACVASLKRFCTCCTQSRPVTSIRAMMSGSVSLLDSSNSFLACFCSFWFHGSPVFSSAQWKCLAVLKISRYNDRASLRRVRSVRCFAGVILWEGTQILGGILYSIVPSFCAMVCYNMLPRVLYCVCATSCRCYFSFFAILTPGNQRESEDCWERKRRLVGNDVTIPMNLASSFSLLHNYSVFLVAIWQVNSTVLSIRESS